MDFQPQEKCIFGKIAKGKVGRGQFVPQVPTFCAYFLHTVKNSILIKKI